MNCCTQSAYAYNSLADFYADANDFAGQPEPHGVAGLAAPLPGALYEHPRPRQAAAAAERLVRRRLRAGRMAAAVEPHDYRRRARRRVPRSTNTAYQNAKADALTFRDEDGSPVQFETGKMPATKLLWSPRVGLNWDIGGQQRTQLRSGTGLFTGPPLYVWISNQLGNTGVLQRRASPRRTPTAFPFNTNPDRYKPTNVTGAGAASFELNVTDNDFKFPQVWRNNIAVDHRLPGGVTGTVEFIYNQGRQRHRLLSTPTCPQPRRRSPASTTVRAVDRRTASTTRPERQVTNAIVMKNQDVGRSWNLSSSLAKTTATACRCGPPTATAKSRNTIDPGSTAFASWSATTSRCRPEQPGPRLLGVLARDTGCSCRRVLLEAVLRLRFDDASRRSGRPGLRIRTSATSPATSSRRHERRRRCG